jgi:ABC-type branched-subunit amino acid transport system permease subunit
VASPFFTFQIGAQSLALGLIALSLTFLGGYGGMVSLAQMTVAGLAGYLGRDLRQQQPGRDQPGLALVAGRGLRDRCWPPCSPPRSAGCRCAPRASTPS